jgi:hypothetical protein
MSDSGLVQGPFVVSAGPRRIILLAPFLVLAGVVFLFLALVMVYVDVANLPGRLALWGAALGFAAMAIYFLLLAASLAMRVEVAPDALRLRIPRWQGVLPWFPWIRAAIPYADIAAVETRDDVYSSFGLTSVQTVYSVATKAGRRIVLGFTSPLATWNYPFDEAAARIARNAGGRRHRPRRGGGRRYHPVRHQGDTAMELSKHRRRRAGHGAETSRARYADRVRHGGGGGCAQGVPAARAMRRALVADLDHRVAGAVLLHQRIQRGSVDRMQPDAAVGGRAPEIFDLVGAVDGVAAEEEDRVGHGRAAIDRGAVIADHGGRLEGADRRAIAGPRR